VVGVFASGSVFFSCGRLGLEMEMEMETGQGVGRMYAMDRISILRTSLSQHSILLLLLPGKKGFCMICSNFQRHVLDFSWWKYN
jgi:hypothetical protein